MPSTAAERAPDRMLVVAAALVDADGRVLVQQRPAGAQHGGLWEFPGGKVEPGETPEAALIRELAEELAIDVETACLAPAVFASAPPLLLLLFVCRKWSGVPMPTEGAPLRWLRPPALHGLALPPADRTLIGLLEVLL